MRVQPLSPSSLRWRLIVVLALAATMSALVIAHVPGLNGPWYWMWAWRRLSAGIYPLLLLAAVPFFIGQWIYWRRRSKHATLAALALVMLATLSLQLTLVCLQPLGFKRIDAIVRNSVNTSYYDAAKVLTEQMDRGKSYRDWLEIYPQLMPNLMLHAGYKPPGLILYYVLLIRIFGEGYIAATAGGWIIALLACAGVAATYALIRTFGASADAAFCGASFFALTPALVGFFPQADQAYPLLSCVLLVLWINAMRTGNRWLAVAFGAWLTFLLMLTPTFLIFGGFLALYTLLYIRDAKGKGFARAIQQSAFAMLILVALFVIMWMTVGFDPIETFRVAADRSQAHLIELQRPWPIHSAFDVIDIALGTGWMSFALAAMGALTLWRSRDAQCNEGSARRLILLGLVQVGLAVAVAVFPGENARLMLPMMPLLMAAVGVELERWSFRARMVVYVALILVTAAIWQNMIPLYMGEEIEGVPRVSSSSCVLRK